MTRLVSWLQLFQAALALFWIVFDGLPSPAMSLLAGVLIGAFTVDGVFGVLTGRGTLTTAWRYANASMERGRIE